MEFDLDVEDGSAWHVDAAKLARRNAMTLLSPGGGEQKLKRRRFEEDSYALSSASTTDSESGGKWNHKFGPQAPGPMKLEDLHNWPYHAAEAMRLEGGASLGRIQQKFWPATTGIEQAVTITTNYSGSGAAEEGTCYACKCMADVIGRAMHVRCYSACDPAPEAQQALLHHDAESKPEHIFDSVTDRFPIGFVRKLDRCKQLWKSRAQRRMPLGATTDQRREVITRHEKKFLAAAKARFNDCVVDKLKKSFCRVHKTECCAYPGDDAGFTIEIAGTTCVPFSSMSRGVWRWLDVSATPCLAWLFYIATTRPRMVVHECVPGFDVPVVEDFLEALYEIQSLVFCTSDLGMPNTRRRRYTLMLLKPLRFNLPFDVHHFGRIAFRRRVADARIFFDADNFEQKKIYAEMAAKAKMTLKRNNGRYFSWHSLLTRGCHNRLMKYAEAAVNEYGTEHVPFLVVNIAQRQEWVGQMKSIVPALLRHSNIWVLMSDRQARPALPSELLAVQCFSAGRGGMSNRSSCGTYAAWQAGAVTSAQVVKLAGNSMSQAAVGLVVLFGLACCSEDLQ